MIRTSEKLYLCPYICSCCYRLCRKLYVTRICGGEGMLILIRGGGSADNDWKLFDKTSPLYCSQAGNRSTSTVVMKLLSYEFIPQIKPVRLSLISLTTFWWSSGSLHRARRRPPFNDFVNVIVMHWKISCWIFATLYCTREDSLLLKRSLNEDEYN